MYQAVVGLSTYLRGHKFRRAAESPSLSIVKHGLLAKPKIDNLNMAIFPKQYII